MISNYSTSIETSISVEHLWAIASNTEHANRVLGLPPVEYEVARAGQPSFVRNAQIKFGPLTLAWEDYPFEFSAQKMARVRRVPTFGPFRSIVGTMTIEPTNEQKWTTTLRLECQVESKLWVYVPLAKILAWVATRSLRDYFIKALALAERTNSTLVPLRATKHQVNRDRLQRRTARLCREHPRLSEGCHALAQTLCDSDDDEIISMQAFRLAELLNVERLYALELCLSACQFGILDLSWELMCPHCRTGKSSSQTLGGLASTYFCEFCGMEFGSDLETYTELRFSPNAAIRKIAAETFCISSPQKSPHVLHQRIAPSFSKQRDTVELPDQPMQIRTLSGNKTLALMPKLAGAHHLAAKFDGEWSSQPLEFKPGFVGLTIENQTVDPQCIALEMKRWDPYALTASEAFGMPQFRGLLLNQVLSATHRLGIKDICIMFTDLEGSTALYEKIGDTRAYADVHRHFGFLQERVVARDGCIIKTIGDAVMAAFPSPKEALLAGLSVQSDIDNFNSSAGLSEPILLRVGFFSGPAIMINANGQNDYFGRTVNIAARIAALSEGGDIVTCASQLDESEFSQLVPASAQWQTFSAHLRGVGEPFTIVRIRGLAAADAGPQEHAS